MTIASNVNENNVRLNSPKIIQLTLWSGDWYDKKTEKENLCEIYCSFLLQAFRIEQNHLMTFAQMFSLSAVYYLDYFSFSSCHRVNKSNAENNNCLILRLDLM